MGYEQRELGIVEQAQRLAGANFLPKILLHVDGTPRVCERVRYYLTDIEMSGAWAGPAALALAPHALAPVADLPVLGVRIEIAITAYIADRRQLPKRIRTNMTGLSHKGFRRS